MTFPSRPGLRRPTHQVIRVAPVIERDTARGVGGGAFTGRFEGLMRCYLLDGGRTVAELPVRFDDQGNPVDLVWTPSHVEVFDKLLFVFDGKTYTKQLTEPQICRPGQSVHLALRHLRLVDRFGTDVLAKGT